MGVLRLHILVLFILLMLMFLVSCGTSRPVAMDQRRVERDMEQRYRESEILLEQARQRHYEMQTPETQKRMDETRRKSDVWNRGGVPFYVKWYWAVISLLR